MRHIDDAERRSRLAVRHGLHPAHRLPDPVAATRAMTVLHATEPATVHLAEIGTTLVSGVSHWRFGNVDWRVVAKIGLPGAVGAFAGATFLSSLDTSVAAPLMSIILLVLGLYVLLRFTFHGLNRQNLGKPMRKRFLGPLGLVAGFVDATGGGGWGPVGTPAILASGRPYVVRCPAKTALPSAPGIAVPG